MSDYNKTDGKRNFKFAVAKAALILMFVAVMAFSAFAFAACNNGGKDSADKAKHKAKLLFSDEFNGEMLDVEKWSVHSQKRNEGDPGEVRRGGWWTADSVSVKDGSLVISTVYDIDKNTFYTGSVDAKEKMTYGFYEARCKLPEAKGLWSAFWIMCDEMGLENPDATVGGAEIDIFESPFYQGGAVQHAIHTGGYGSKHQDNFTLFPITLSHSDEVENGYEEWHTFALDWQPSGYIFYIDGVETWRTTDTYHIGDVTIEDNVSSVPSYIILSVEVGGNDGVPGPAPFLPNFDPVSSNRNQYDMSDFRVDFLVDYVRVWDKCPY